MEGLIRLTAALVVGSVLMILLFLLKESIPFFREYSLGRFLGGEIWAPLESVEGSLYGAKPLIAGTLVTTLLAVLLALPVGVFCAVYMSELAPGRIKNVLKSTVEMLAGIPSVVIGFVGMTVLVPFFRETFHLATGLNAVTGALLLALMALPTIISISEDALHAVPQDYRQASLALGATRLQTIWRSVVPAAGRGIVAAGMLGLGRAIGETMTVLMVTGNAAVVPKIETFLKGPDANDLFFSVRTLTATIAAEMGETPRHSTHYHALFALGAILFIITFAVNTIADLALRRGRSE
jgi:phosphate transport system permease protein